MTTPRNRPSRPMLRWLASFAMLAALAPAANAALPANIEKVTEKGGITEYRVKSNGMPVLLVPRHDAPVVTFFVVYHIGSRNEFPGCTGSAHLLEHMLFNKSTAHFGKASPGGKTIQVALHEVGVDFGSTNMTTWTDRMTGFSTVPSEHLELAMQIEADRMQTGKILDSERQPEMSVVRNEYEIGENNPLNALEKAVTGAAIVAHPYHWDTIGYRSDIEGVTTDQLRDHYHKFFWPDNACAIIVGDFDPDGALAMLDKYFGKMPKAPAPIPKVITVEPEQEGERRVIVSRPGATGYIMLAYPRPGTLDPDWHALEVLNAILGNGRSSRLYQGLVETGLAASATVESYAFRDPFLLFPYAQLAPGVPHAKVEASMQAVLDSVVDHGVTQEEVDRAVRGIEVDFASNQDGVYSMAENLGEAVASANWQWYVDFLDNVRKVTPADVQRVAKKYIVPDHRTVGWFVPKVEPGEKVGAISTDSPAGAAAAAAGTPGPLGMILFPALNDLAGSPAGGSVVAAMTPGTGAAASASRAGFEARTMHKEWPHRLILDVLPTHGAPTVAISGILRAGSALAPADRPELAAMTASMLTRGTASRSKMQIARQLEDLGASMNFNAGAVDLNISSYGMSRDLPTLVALLADQLLHPSFSADELDRVRKQRKGALLSQAENTQARAGEAMARIEYPEGHPFRPMPILDRARSVDAVTLEDIQAFYAKTYHGGSLELAIVGDVDPAAVVALVDKEFADLKAGDAPALEAPRVTARPAQRSVETLKGKANMDLLYALPPSLRRTDDDYYAAVIANAVLGQDALTSRAGKRVRDTEGLTYNLFSRFFGTDLLDGMWGLDVAVAPQNLKKALASTLDEIQKFARGGITQQELDAQKGFFSGNFKVQLATNTGISRALSQAEKYGFGPGYLDEYPRKMQAVTLEQANAAIRKHFDASNLSLVVAGDLEQLPTP